MSGNGTRKLLRSGFARPAIAQRLSDCVVSAASSCLQRLEHLLVTFSVLTRGAVSTPGRSIGCLRLPAEPSCWKTLPFNPSSSCFPGGARDHFCSDDRFNRGGVFGLGFAIASCSWLFSGRPVAAADESLYDILGVDKGASEEEIKKAYKRSAVRNHPDKAPPEERAEYEERFKRISRAYEILSDPQKRQTYDLRGASAFDGNDANGGPGMAQGGFQAGGDPFEMFSSMFGRGFDVGRRTPDVGYFMEVSLEEIFTGCTRDIRYNQDIVCTRCRGRGATRIDRCRACGGRGATVSVREISPGYVQQVQRQCQACGGRGSTIPAGAFCQECNGGGMKQREIHLPVEVPPGCQEGRVFKFPGKADEAPDLATGDIIVEIREKKHKTFKRYGDDLLIDQRVSLLDALCGVRFTLKHLDGADLEVQCPAVVRPGDVWVVKGRGMPRSSRGSRERHGDLLVRFEVDFPERMPGSGDANLRDQLRPLLDPKAPATAGDSSSGSFWSGLFGAGGGGDTAKSVTASKAGPGRVQQIAEMQARRESEQASQQQQRRGGAECKQM
eukprot:TRINITY_DN38719_c0_g1_i1.p1 TRINITY_DN38719_c0_g1~~TRINITY_DN38719_c0_g1_i1.p1  ORF type:complete len:555 (-),score=98.86 TRINITY_DN38719_c0_g1_i1:245-1909(-)